MRKTARTACTMVMIPIDMMMMMLLNVVVWVSSFVQGRGERKIWVVEQKERKRVQQGKDIGRY
jgi:hypothetical protein